MRFPTSRALDGSDAMNPAPDYSAAYVVVRVDDGRAGHGFAFTIGRGNEVELAAIRALEPLLVGLDVEEVLGDLGATASRLVSDSHLRWLGPDKGVVHMAVGAVTNALFDLAAKRTRQPLWRYLCDQQPEDLVRLIDFSYLTDALSPAEALELFERGAEGKHVRIAELERSGYQAYTSSPGWLGYSERRMSELCAAALDDGFELIKLKVGADLADDVKRCTIARNVISDNAELAVDANQMWDVDEAIHWVGALAPFDLAWVEEPTHPDDVLGYARIKGGRTASAAGHGRERRQQGYVQTASSGAGYRHHADRRVQGGGGYGEPGKPCLSHEVRHPRLPSCGRSWFVRGRPPPRVLRLCGTVGLDDEPSDRMDRPPP